MSEEAEELEGEEEPEEAELTEEEILRGELTELTAKALRGPRAGSEPLIANELAMALLSEQLEKIRHVCEAIMLLNPEERGMVGLSRDYEEVRRVHALAETFKSAHRKIDTTSWYSEEKVQIGWPFDPKDTKKWIGWIFDLGRLHYSHYLQREEYEKVEAFLHLYLAGKEGLTVESFRMMRVRFVYYAMPKCMSWFKQVMRLVSPSSFQEALELMRGVMRGKPKASKV